MMKNIKKLVVVCMLLVAVAGGVCAHRIQSVKQETPTKNVVSVTPTSFVSWKRKQENTIYTVTREAQNGSTTEWWWRNPSTGKKEMMSSITIKKPEYIFVGWKDSSDSKNAKTVVTVDPTSEGKIFSSWRP